MRPVSYRQQEAMREEFWATKRREGLRAEMLDAQRRGDPLAYYAKRDELAGWRAG